MILCNCRSLRKVVHIMKNRMDLFAIIVQTSSFRSFSDEMLFFPKSRWQYSLILSKKLYSIFKLQQKSPILFEFECLLNILQNKFDFYFNWKIPDYCHTTLLDFSQCSERRMKKKLDTVKIKSIEFLKKAAKNKLRF